MHTGPTAGQQLRHRYAAGFAILAVALTIPSVVAAAPVVGETFYSDGTLGKAGPAGTRISVKATGATTGIPDHLVMALSLLGTRPGVCGSVHDDDPYPVLADSSGNIPPTPGRSPESR